MNVISDSSAFTYDLSTGVPDCSQPDYLLSSFGTAYCSPDDLLTQFDNSLVTSPTSLELSKMGGIAGSRGDLPLGECGEVFDNCIGMTVESDWLNQSISLPAPGQQEGAINLLLHSSALASPAPFTEFSKYSSPLSPESSYPPTPMPDTPTSYPSTPLSDAPTTPTNYDSDFKEIKDVLSLFSDPEDRQLRSLTDQYLPFDCVLVPSAESSPSYSPVLSPVPSHSPVLSPAPSHSPILSPSSSFSENSISSICDLWMGESSLETSSCLQTPKRMALTSKESSESKPKRSCGVRRRLNQAAKKERKREQNKTSALRYRQKKKVEQNDCFTQLETLEQKNAQLKKTVNCMTAEIEYLKELWSASHNSSSSS